jgi:5'-3' exonuclease
MLNVKAPGEAEAELARLNQAGIIDIVLTDNSDVFLFGATRVMRTYVPEYFHPLFAHVNAVHQYRR